MAQDTELHAPTPPVDAPQDEPLLGERHPLAHIIGAYKDDPMLDAVMEEVYKNRRRLEAEAATDEQEDLAA